MQQIINYKKIYRSIMSLSIVFLLVFIPTPVFAETNTEIQNSVQAGVQYIADNQAPDGGITGLGGESDWSVVAIEASGKKASEFENTGNSLKDYLATDALNTSSTATTIERRIIAIEASGGDSANFGGIDYQALLQGKYFENQIGEKILLNDDVFGIIAIAAIENDDLKNMAQDSLNYLLSNQAGDGGFSYTTDTCAWCGSDSNDTAASIIAMHAGEKLGLLFNSEAKNKALVYLLSTQKDDGGFGYDVYSPSDGSSTAWGLMALNTFGDSVKSQALLARNWLLNNQNTDGGFSFGAYEFNQSDTYTTAHAIIALLGSTWLLSPAPLNINQQTAGRENTESEFSAPTQAKPNINLVSSTSQAPEQTAERENEGSVLAATGESADFNQKTKPLVANVSAASTAKYFGIGLISLVALAWFVLESRKAKGVN